MYALTITDNVYNQAKKLMCDLIISHHPLFSVPVKYRDIQMYCAHTNMDKASGGTTDTLIEKLGWRAAYSENEFVRVVMLQNPLNVNQLAEKLRIISPKLRYVNNNNIKEVRSIAFCAGSFIKSFVKSIAAQIIFALLTPVFAAFSSFASCVAILIFLICAVVFFVLYLS